MCDRLVNNNNPFLPDVPLHLDPLLKPSTQQNINKTSHNPNINLEFKKKNHHFRKASCLRHSKDRATHFPEPKRVRRPYK